MGRADGTAGRRLRLVRLSGPRDTEPRVDALNSLLREVDELRLTLETDLTLAASAVESGEPGLAAEILDSDRDALRGFESRALSHLMDLPEQPADRRTWAHVHAGPVVAAAALVAVLAGVLPQALAPHASPNPSVAATASLERIQQLAASGDTAEVRAASAQLHAQLASVVAAARTDPAAAQNALVLLSFEQSAIVRSGDGVVLADVLRQAAALASAIRAALPPAARPATAAVPAVEPAPTSKASAKPAPKPSPSPSASPKPKPAASPKASPSPSSSDCPIPMCAPTP